MKRVIMVHGWSESPETTWFPWLRTALIERGFEVVAPSMPDTDEPSIDAWVPYLAKIVGSPDQNTYFIGHSIGCQTIMRYLETQSERVGGALFVAGWFYLENLETEEEIEVSEEWRTTPIDIAKVRTVLPRSTLIISETDDWGAVEANRRKFSELVTHEIVLPDAGHIVESEHPEILDAALTLLA